MKYLTLVAAFTFSLLAQAAVRCSDTHNGGAYTFVITLVGNFYEIWGDNDGRYKGHCQTLSSHRNGRVLLSGISGDTWLRNQCYAEIRLGIDRGSEVSVPDDKTFGAVKGEMLLCTGEL